jgi:hypothetical protein
MVHRAHWPITAALAIAANGLAFAQPSPTGVGLTAAVRTAVSRGELLYIYDEAGWHGTDDFLANYAGLAGQAGGYVVSGDDLDAELVFYDKSKSNAVYRAKFINRKLVKSGPAAADRVALTAIEKQLIAAKDKALAAFIAANVGLCSASNPNLAALPPERPGGPVIVYIMTSSTTPDTVPLGGHYSVEVAADGSVGPIRHFTKACIDMPMNKKPPVGEPVAFVVTHLLDPTPTEIHVFSSLTSKVPLIVVTSPDARMWLVDGNKVSSMPAPKKP